MERTTRNYDSLNRVYIGLGPFFRDEYRNVWYKEFRRVNALRNDFSLKISMIKRRDGRYGPLVIRRESKVGFIQQGDTIDIGSIDNGPSITFLAFNAPDDEFYTGPSVDTKRINLISSDGTQFPVKKSLRLKIEFYQSMLKGKFKEASCNEIQMQEEASTVAALVKYLEAGFIDCGLRDLVRLGKMAHMRMMPGLMKRIGLDICARFDQNDPEEDWDDALELACLLKSRWILLAYAHRVQKKSK